MFQLFNTVSDDKTIKSISSSNYQKILPVKGETKVLNFIDDIENNKDKAFVIEDFGRTSWYFYKYKLTRIYEDGDGIERKICSIFVLKRNLSMFFILENNTEVTISYVSEEKIEIKLNNSIYSLKRDTMKWIGPK